MLVAAVNFDAVFADVGANLDRAAGLVEKAAAQGAALVLLPEFFTSSMGFSQRMLAVAGANRDTPAWLRAQSARHGVILGGSFIAFDGTDACNVFQLAFPDGSVFAHSKDIPTLAENCYFTGGDTVHILRTPIGNIGVALCWEMVRCDTLRRLSGAVDFVLAGTCWADLPDWEGGEALKQYNRDFALRTPARFARLLHAPVIHANHCGWIEAYDYPDDTRLHTLRMIGATQVLDAQGAVLAERAFDAGEGLVVADIGWEAAKRPADVPKDAYWIEDLPPSYRYAWEHHNATAAAYYREVARPYYAAQRREMDAR